MGLLEEVGEDWGLHAGHCVISVSDSSDVSRIFSYKRKAVTIRSRNARASLLRHEVACAESKDQRQAHLTSASATFGLLHRHFPSPDEKLKSSIIVIA